MTLRIIGAIAALIMTFDGAVTAQDPAKLTGPLETTSRLGRKLYALPDDGSIKAAQQALSSDPKNVDVAIKLSKAQAARRQYREAVVTCTAAIKSAPKSADLYLERGHRELGLRQFKAGLADLNMAVELDPQMLEAQYHLGMAHYFLGEFDLAAKYFRRALDLAKTTDSVIDGANWLYVGLRRAGHKEAADEVLKRITPDVKNTGPHMFFYLQLLHFYQGVVTEDKVLPPAPANADDIEGELSYNTTNYGIGNWHLYNDKDPGRAAEYFSRVVKGYAWNSWGFIGSEIELTKNKH